ncbi:helix-turn-helix domain-containing protein, partial [Paraclostridium sordellii]|uniref:helix-turn-helix domain-containing protein n=1 Tax=Paraclostridium sordellii TaxID=1505 RepID=UPI0018CE90AC
MENKEVVLGNNICRKIDYLIKNKNLSKTEFANIIKKTPSALNKILHDLKKGNISLKNLIIISDGLEI